MKILHLSLCSQFNDSLTYQENLLIKYHQLFGHELSVITTTLALNNSGFEEELTPGVYASELGFNIYRLKSKGIKKLRRFYGLINTLDSIKPDFIFIHGSQFWDSLKLVKYCKTNGIPIVIDNHADYYNSGGSWVSLNVIHKILWRYTTQKLVNYSHLIFGVSPIRCEFLHDIYRIPNKYIELLPLGADDYVINEIKEKMDVQRVKAGYEVKDEFLIVTGGKIDQNKNFISLLKAIKKLKSSFNVKLLIFGTIYKEVEEEINELNLSDLFVNLGWLGPEEMYKLFLISDLNVFIGSHSVLWEQAIACGKPTIFKKIKGMEHVNVCDNSVLIEDPHNIDKLESVLIQFINDKEYYNSILKNSIEAAAEFSYSQISKRAILS